MHCELQTECEKLNLGLCYPEFPNHASGGTPTSTTFKLFWMKHTRPLAETPGARVDESDKGHIQNL